MQDEAVDPYKPPESSLEGGRSSNSSPSYFTTSSVKLILMSVCSFGLYELWWFYKNWVVIKQQTGQKIMPIGRAIFAPLWAYNCFDHIRYSAIKSKLPGSLPAGLLGICYLGLNLIVQLPDPYWLLSLMSFVIIIPVNQLASRINMDADPDYQPNGRFSPLNILMIVVGGLLVLLMLIGFILPPLEPAF